MSGGNNEEPRGIFTIILDSILDCFGCGSSSEDLDPPLIDDSSRRSSRRRGDVQTISSSVYPTGFTASYPSSSRQQPQNFRHASSRQAPSIFPHGLPKFENTIVSVDESDLASQTFDQSAAAYREQAQLHLKKSNENYQKAKQFRKINNHERANYYLRQAKKQTRLYEQANSIAAAAYLSENKEKHPKESILDLHHLYVKEAIEALDIFLDEQILSLQDQELQKKCLEVITGRGKHSAHGIPKIKPAVMTRLRERNLRYSEKNAGSLRVQIFKHSCLTHDLPEP